ncbi:Protein W02A11.1 [Aphelenchoides avenae]|nr:Protein W02A11.1 [Aphelenchus avenae]
MSLIEKASSVETTEHTGTTFLRHKDFIEEGDTVIIYLNHNALTSVVVKRGMTLNMKYGALRHEFLIGKPYGTPITATAGYVYALRPTPALWTRALSRQTQILYTPDIATILLLLDVKPGAVICESGTGSGSLSHAIATAVAPTGHLYTHDIEEPRVRKVENELKQHGLTPCTTVVQQDVCEDGFFVENACDGVFLDLPAPWKAVPHAKLAISRVRGGRLVSFSPCIEQVQQCCLALEEHGFIQIETIEVVPRQLRVVYSRNDDLSDLDAEKSTTTNGEEDAPPAKRAKNTRKWTADATETDGEKRVLTAIPFPPQQPTHTGYLTSATLLPS